jgi:uncharacterized iron-regulated membrane protein
MPPETVERLPDDALIAWAQTAPPDAALKALRQNANPATRMRVVRMECAPIAAVTDSLPSDDRIAWTQHAPPEALALAKAVDALQGWCASRMPLLQSRCTQS